MSAIGRRSTALTAATLTVVILAACAVSVLANLHPGQKVPVKLLRRGKGVTVTVTLGELRG